MILNVSYGFVIEVHIGILQKVITNIIYVVKHLRLKLYEEEINYSNEHQPQEVKNVINGDIKIFIVDTNSNKKYIASERQPITVGR